MFDFAADKKGLVIVSGILSALSAIASFVPFVAVYFVIAMTIAAYPDVTRLDGALLTRYGVLALGGVVLHIVLYACALLCSHFAAFGTAYRTKLDFSAHISKLPLGVFMNFGSGRLRKIMDDDIGSVEDYIAHRIPDIVASVAAPLTMVVIVLALDWRFGLVVFAAIVLAFVIQFSAYGGSGVKDMVAKFNAVKEDMGNASVEYVRGMPVVKAFRQTVHSFRRLNSSIQNYTEFVLKFTLAWENSMSGFMTLINNIYVFLLPLGILIGATTGDYRTFALSFMFYLVFVPAVSGILHKIMYITESSMRVAVNAGRVDAVLDTPALPEPCRPLGAKDGVLDGVFDVVFDDVSFSYRVEGGRDALSQVSFRAEQGKVTAIVGPSGSGKSTIAHLIPRFWDVNSGAVKLGGVDVRELPADYLMKQISFVFQDSFLFKQSILDNITMGKPDATVDDAVAAAKAAQCHDFIEKLPDGYRTVIGNQGRFLSGGEQQRIAIARAIVKNAPVIVLDEATAFADPENELLIQEALGKLIGNKTLIVIAHRLATIRKADTIIVMDKGRVAEQGTHDALLRAQGLYALMWDRYTQAVGWKLRTKKEAV
ncbi:MAG: ABC transporter ATP-binding protein/permease [Treponema sp.]|nr:ABC transporter ATP-binding protein/permease [Treponema sp.]